MLREERCRVREVIPQSIAPIQFANFVVLRSRLLAMERMTLGRSHDYYPLYRSS